MDTPTSLYVHLPFCAELCAYCDFAKVLFNPKWAFSYVAKLKEEILSYPIPPLKTLYIGGGTPSVLPPDLLADLLAFLSPYVSKETEFTVEANPESLSAEKLEIFRHYGVNRLSLGGESASPRLLELMGRHHRFSDVQQAVERAKKAHFDNISVDLIYALPGESLEELKGDIAAFLSLDVPHLSAYCLSVNPGTLFALRGFQEMEEGAAADQYECLLRGFRAAGYDRYEVSNFARPGFQSRHNCVYWRDQGYFAAGLGAAGYVDDVRYSNTRSLSRYLQGQYRAEEERVVPSEDLKYYFLTNLRLEAGFLESDFQTRFGFSFAEKYAKQLTLLAEEGLLIRSKGSIKATDRGILLLDRVLLALY